MLQKSAEMVFACKKCKKCFRKDAAEFEERYVRPARTAADKMHLAHTYLSLQRRVLPALR